MRHHHIPSALKLELQARVREELGIKIGGLTGLYVYFVLLADKLLSENAVASWLLPAEFLYVNYGRPLREYLSKRVSLISIHHFDSESVQFNDALVSSCIVTYMKKYPSARASFAFSVGESLSNPREVKAVDLSEFEGLQKWTMLHFEGREPNDEEQYALEDFFDVRRGIATGANDFFIVDQDIIKEFSIPRLFLKPVLPGPRFLSQDVIAAKPDGSPDVDKPAFLLDCDLAQAVVQAQYPGLWAYLQRGVEKGLNERYLCASREVWYFQEKRLPSLYMATYMGRSNGQGKCPIRFFLNLSQAIATNVYLHLYPKPELLDLLGGDETRLKELLGVLNGILLNEFLREGRAYGGGLHKMEPGELRKLRLTNLPEWLTKIIGRQLVLV